VSAQHLEVRELAAWGFDHPIDREFLGEKSLLSAATQAQDVVMTRSPYPAESALSEDESGLLANALATRKDAVALSGEFDGLEWEIAIVDLRKLIAFQRRIGFTYPDSGPFHCGSSAQQLLDLALPIYAPCKCPYMEAAFYRGRWFLRDGYHRSFRLLNQSVHMVPCVVVYAETLSQLGAVGNQFFSQDVLFSEHPPMVTDFLNEETTVRYRRALPGKKVSSAVPQLQQLAAASCHLQEIR